MIPQRIKKRLQAHPGWRSAEQQLIRDFEFPTFQDAVRFLDVVSRIAREKQHAIEATVKGGLVTLGISAANDGELTESQFALAGLLADALVKLGTDEAA